MSVHWGDLPVLSDTEGGFAEMEREQMTKMRPLEIQGPKLHQPTFKTISSSDEPYSAEDFSLDNITMHTIKLIQHTRKVRHLIQNAQQILDNSKNSEETITFAPPPPMPEFHANIPKHQFQKPVPFLAHTRDSDFVCGNGKPPPVIDASACRRLLRRSVAAICAHAGFDVCAESILEMLTDICTEYYLEITGLLRRAVDAEATIGYSSFQDPLEQVFNEMGFSSPDLHEFYQNRIIHYHENMCIQAGELLREYEALKNPDLRGSEEMKFKSMKEDMLSDINFPCVDDSEEASDTDQVIPMEAIGMDISIVQDAAGMSNSEEENPSVTPKWPQQTNINDEESTIAQGQTVSGSSLTNTDNNIPSIESTTNDHDESQNMADQASHQSEVETSDTDGYLSPIATTPSNALGHSKRNQKS